jgi:hypothetical protein
MLWLAETRAYVRRNRPIASATYVREPSGPVAKETAAVREELQREGKVGFVLEGAREHNVVGFVQMRLSATDGSDIVPLDPHDLEDVDWAVTYASRNAPSASADQRTPDYGWQIAEVGEVIPYQSALARRIRHPEGDELAWAQAKSAERS